ncbi:3-methyladenine DNA glycosylase/8-oxoguanine DNA glycosylase [Cenarchaeum symbiosum A]|uniref:DNA-(apurinic or apyrimidinic site) lyase n=1 Tax=Cenarchaeum symbiosum (strain A) TaxID=414004 RepID=A0RY52_CENSY|nr:3-methyladenine DNA glycosylase/8-oxoguanine DNA glycosylase [Cenarchaeum symbiosum A]
MAKAVKKYPGLRLLRQDPFQCCISFMASSNSSIPCIRDRLRRICSTFGKKTKFRGEEFRVFPRPRDLASASRAELLSCGLGYRVGFIKDASAEAAGGGLDLASLRRSGYQKAMEALIAVPGIGGKIADCVMLFSLDKLEAFPIDRWTMRILERYYSRAVPLPPGTLTPKKYAELHDKVVEYFGPYAGYAQQFLFKMERDLGGGRWLQDRDSGPTPGQSTGSSRRR